MKRMSTECSIIRMKISNLYDNLYPLSFQYHKYMIESNKQEVKEIGDGKKEVQAVESKDDDDNHDLGKITNWGYFLLFSYLYVVQGIVSGFAATMPYLYSQLPDQSTMAIFNSTNLPFSFKFLIAPFLQKFSFVSYGKRKTWFIISLIYSGLIIFTSSFFTDYRYDNLIGILFILSQVGMAFLDISAHAAMVKELKSPAQASIILSYSQSVGNVIGGLFLLKFTSKEFSQSIGLSEPITTPQVFLIIYALMTFLPAILVHFYFKETVLQSEKRGSKFSFCEIVSYYSIFFKPSSRYFRLCVFFLIYQQGFNFFTSLYDYKLVEAGFSRDTSNTISNLILLPVIVSTFFYATWTNYLGGKAKSLMIVNFLLIACYLFLLIVFPLNTTVIFFTSLIQNILSSWMFFIGAWQINSFSPHALTGMFITFNASFSNFGALTSIHTILCSKFGWELCSYIGLGIQFIIALCMIRLFKWLEEGDSHVPKEIEEPEADEHHQPLPQDQ